MRRRLRRPGLVQWWFEALTEAQRQRLVEEVDGPLDPDLALELWRRSGPVHVVEPAEWSVKADPLRWRLTEQAAAFVRARRRERGATSWLAPVRRPLDDRSPGPRLP